MVYVDSDDSSEEDDGNFKRRRRHGSDSEEEDNSRDSRAGDGRRPTRVADSRADHKMVERQRDSDRKASRLTKYDDVIDNDTTTTCGDIKIKSRSSSSATTSRSWDRSSVISTKSRSSSSVSTSRSSEDSSVVSKNRSTADETTESKADPRVKKETTTAIEVSTEDNDTNNRGDHLTNDDSDDANTSTDPRLRRLKKMRTNSEESYSSRRDNGIPLRERVHQLLIKRKPMEAYNELKQDVKSADMCKYKDQLLDIAKDWFPAIVYNAYDPRTVYIEGPQISSFQNLMRDVFNVKTKLKHFWETIIIEIQKFIDETRIKTVPQLLTKLRWVLVKDIRDHLMEEDIQIGIRATNVIIDQRIVLQVTRDAHRRQFEATVTPAANPSVKPQVATVAPYMSSTPTSSLFADMIPLTKPKAPTPVPTPPVQVVDEMESMGADYMKGKPTHETSDSRILQIGNFLTGDQYMKLVQMMSRHITNTNFTVIEEFGRALRFLLSHSPKASIFDIFRKIHDTIKLNNSFPEQRLILIFEKLLKEFLSVTQYNPKEWILLRDFTVNSLAHIPNNPFNERFIPIKHNVVYHLDYTNANNGLVIKYDDFDRDIPLIAKNAILRDPRIEFRCDETAGNHELGEAAPIGMFSPIKVERSSSASWSPPSVSPQHFESSAYDSEDSQPQPAPPPPPPPPPVVAVAPIIAPPVPVALPIRASPVKPVSADPRVNRMQASVKPQPPQRKPISAPTAISSRIDPKELKKIVRKVQVSSDESDDE